MGDFKKTKKQEIAEAREEKIQETAGTIRKLTRQNASAKTQVISAKISPEVWATFKRINRIRGMANNSVINMLITDYIKANSSDLE